MFLLQRLSTVGTFGVAIQDPPRNTSEAKEFGTVGTNVSFRGPLLTQKASDDGKESVLFVREGLSGLDH